MSENEQTPQPDEAKPKENESYEDYRQRYHEQARARLTKDADAVGLVHLEEIGVKVTFLCEKKRLTFTHEPEDAVLQAMLAKLTQEIFAYAGALRAGSLVGAYHHFRAVIELRAAIRHVFGTPEEVATRSEKKTQERAHKFAEWPVVSAYSAHRRSLARLNKHPDDERAKARFDRETRVTSGVADQTDETLERWAKTYARGKGEDALAYLNSGRIHEWHSPRALMDLIDEIDTPSPESAIGWYEIACNATHVSPSANALASGLDGVRLLGWNHEHAAIGVVHMLHQTLMAVSELAPHCEGVFDHSVENEWRELKKLLRAMALSEAYRQGARIDENARGGG